MISFVFFPFAILIPFFFITLIFRIFNHRNSQRTSFGGIRRILLGSHKVTKLSSDEEFEVYIYRLASKKRGKLSSAQIIVDSGLPMSEVDKRMALIVDNIHVIMDVSESGIIYYEFPELRN